MAHRDRTKPGLRLSRPGRPCHIVYSLTCSARKLNDVHVTRLLPMWQVSATPKDLRVPVEELEHVAIAQCDTGFQPVIGLWTFRHRGGVMFLYRTAPTLTRRQKLVRMPRLSNIENALPRAFINQPFGMPDPSASKKNQKMAASLCHGPPSTNQPIHKSTNLQINQSTNQRINQSTTPTSTQPPCGTRRGPRRSCR